MKKRKKKFRFSTFGFTLTELLEIIIILAIVLVMVLAALGVEKLVNIGAMDAFKNDARMILQQLAHENIKRENFDITQVTLENICGYGLTDSNYSNLKAGVIDNNPYIIIIGAKKWQGLKACGTMKNMLIVPTSDNKTCKDLPDKN